MKIKNIKIKSKSKERMSGGEKVLDIKIKNKNCYQVLQYLRIEN